MVEQPLVNPLFVFFLGLPTLAIAFCLIVFAFGRVLLDTINFAVGEVRNRF